MIKGYLKIMVMNELLKKDCSGYDIMLALESATGKKPSSGSVYPLLNDMLNKSLIKQREQGRKKIYSLTLKGKKSLETVFQERQDILTKKLNMLSLCGDFIDEDEMNTLKKFICHIKDCDLKLMSNLATWAEIHKVSYDIVSSKDFNKKKKKMKDILTKTLDELKELNGE